MGPSELMTAESSVIARWSVVVVGAYLIQIGFLDDLEIIGVHPELMLLVAVCAGLVGGSSRGAEVGFAAGLLTDLLFSGSLGVSALCFTLVGFGVGAAEDSVIGIEAAAKFYFGVPLAELQPQESLALIALLKGPSWFDPFCNRERFEQRYAQTVEKLGKTGPEWSAAAALSRLRPIGCARR